MEFFFQFKVDYIIKMVYLVVGQLVVGVVGQFWVIDVVDLWLLSQLFCNFYGVLIVMFYVEFQGFYVVVQQLGFKGVVIGVYQFQGREDLFLYCFFVFVYYGIGGGIVMAIEVFGCGMYYIVCIQQQWLLKVGGGKGIVGYCNCLMIMG